MTLHNAVFAGAKPDAQSDSLKERLFATRALSSALAAPLSDEDQVVQAMDDASPTKWHLAHTTWFFEAFLLKRFLPGYRLFDERFEYCFNSYYESVGPRHPRPKRGLLTRPSAEEVRAYRAYVDEALGRLCGALSSEAAALIELGINHEQQHQELLLTDILSLFAAEPLKPAYREESPGVSVHGTAPLAWTSFDGGIVEVSEDGENWHLVRKVEADGLFPTMGYVDAGPYDTEPGRVETDFRKPVDPALTLDDFLGLDNDGIVALYNGAGGGAGIDIGSTGLSQISYVRVSNPTDAVPAGYQTASVSCAQLPGRPIFGFIKGRGGVRLWLVDPFPVGGRPAHRARSSAVTGPGRRIHHTRHAASTRARTTTAASSAGNGTPPSRPSIQAKKRKRVTNTATSARENATNRAR